MVKRKSAHDGLTSRLGPTEERISGLDYISLEIPKTEK
jgi:hypothetical protein